MLCLAAAALVWAAGCASAPDLARGQRIWERSCTICHSTREMQRGPLLEGREAWYTRHQLEKFRDGRRGTNAGNRSEVLMHTAMDQLPDATSIRDVAAWIESLPRPSHRRTVRGDGARGRELYTRCAACHGETAEGRRALFKAPRLAGIEDWYLAEQLGKYAKGQRGWHQQDTTGQTMRAAAQGLTPQEIKDLTAFISGL